MTSREKLEATLQSMTGEPPEDAHPMEVAFRGVLLLAGRHIPPALAEYEEDLDELIVKLAEWMLEHRGDDAPPVTLEQAKLQLPAGGA